MSRKFVLLLVYLTVLVGIFVPATVSAEILVGVKAGDRMEYNVDYYAAETPPPADPYLIWRQIEVQSVQGTTVTFDLTWEWSDGTQGTDTMTEDLETGVSEAMIIPANLSNGEVFYHESYGFITIGGVEEKTYAGATRTIVNATVDGTQFRWDKTTGVLVELQFYSESWGAYINIKIARTNMWQRDFFPPIDPTLFYVVIIVAVVMVVVVVFFDTSRKKKRIGRRKKRVSKRNK
jgi:hypothetical protein